MGRWRKLFRPSNGDSLPTADVMQFEPLARRRLSQMAYDYVRSGGGDEISMRENRAGFERLQLAPNVLVDVSQIDTRVNLFGGEFESPILLAPVAYHRLYHRDGEAGHSTRRERGRRRVCDQHFYYDFDRRDCAQHAAADLVPALCPARPGFYQRHGAARGGLRLQGRLPYRGHAGAGQSLWTAVFWAAQRIWSACICAAWDKELRRRHTRRSAAAFTTRCLIRLLTGMTWNGCDQLRAFR